MKSDKIVIEDLLVRCILGIGEEERRDKQDVVINIELYTDLRRPGKTDCLDDAVDYHILKKRVLTFVEQSQCHLVEALAEGISEICLQFQPVREVNVRVHKPGALRFAKSVGVEIVRTRDDK
jgi:FolB domain-containing protein